MEQLTNLTPSPNPVVTPLQPAIASTGQSIKLFERFVTNLTEMLTPVANLTGLSAVVVGAETTAWITRRPECDCLLESAAGAQGAACKALGRKIHEIEAQYGGVSIGRVRACYSAEDRSLGAMIDCLILAASEHLRLQEQEESLLEELSACWESLGAVHEISADGAAIQQPTEVLEKILARAVGLGPEMSGVLWIEEGATLQPYIVNNVSHLTQRSVKEGLLGKALAGMTPISINGRTEISAAAEANPELAGAFGVMVVPISTSHGLLGAFEVWSDEPASKFDSHHVQLMQTLAQQAAMIVENDRLHQTSMQNMRLRQEVEIGSKIQRSLLIGQPPMGMPELAMAALTIPSQSIDGDFYDFIQHSNSCVDVLVGDVMGKGIPAALLGAATKNHFLRAMGQVRYGNDGDRMLSTEEIVTLVHGQVTRQLIDLESFATACYARFDTSSGLVHLVDCGHTRTIRYWGREDVCGTLQGDNMPLGFSEGEIYKEFSVPLENGDVFLFYSDGLTEARSPEGEFFGEERLVEFVKRFHHLTPQALVAKVRDEVTTFANSDSLDDDFTCIAVKMSRWEGLKTLRVVSLVQEMELPAQLARLADVRAFVRKLCDKLPPTAMDQDALAALQLAVNEAAANVIKHAYNECPGKSFQIRGEVNEESVAIELTHFGSAFDPAMAEPPAFDSSRENGFGLFIINQICDEAVYTTPEPGRHIIRLVKKLHEK